jgi:hypothetical protein
MINEPEKQGVLYTKIQIKVINSTEITERISKASGVLIGTGSCLVWVLTGNNLLQKYLTFLDSRMSQHSSVYRMNVTAGAIRKSVTNVMYLMLASFKTL